MRSRPRGRSLGLKPASLLAVGGATEAVPLPKYNIAGQGRVSCRVFCGSQFVLRLSIWRTFVLTFTGLIQQITH